MKKLLLIFLGLPLLWTYIAPPEAGGAEDSLRIAVLGDSLSAGYGLPAEEAFPRQLEKALRDSGYHVSVVDSSVSGDTTAGGRARLDWTLGGNPDVVVVALGGNDALRGLEPDRMRENLDAILSRLREKGVAVLLAGIHSPRNLGREYADRFDRVYPELAAKHGVVLVPFFLEGVAGRPELNLPDGIHPNAKGVKEMVRNLLPYLERVLDSRVRKSQQESPGSSRNRGSFTSETTFLSSRSA